MIILAASMDDPTSKVQTIKNCIMSHNYKIKDRVALGQLQVNYFSFRITSSNTQVLSFSLLYRLSVHELDHPL